MSASEFERWVEFYKHQPFDDLHRYHRPHALLAAVMGSGDVSEYVEWLQPMSENGGYSSADMATMAAFGVKPPGAN